MSQPLPQEITSKLTQWSEKIGTTVEELTVKFMKIRQEFMTNMPGKTVEWYNNAARRRLYLMLKSELRSPAKPFDWIVFGYSAAVDVTRADREQKFALWSNPETRAQAIAEGKVTEDGKPLDTREWMIPPDPSTGFPGRRNPSFGKELRPRWIRTLVGFGRPVSGGDFKLLSILCSAESPDNLPKPPIGKSVRSRVNLRNDLPYCYECNWSTQMRFDPIVIPELEPVTTEKIIELLRSAPSELRPTLNELYNWHKEHEGNPRRLAIVEADVTWINRMPTEYGSYMMVLEDESQEDLEAEGTPCWVPMELKEILDTFGAQSRIFVIGRTNIGPGFDRETRQPLPDVERVQLNAVAIFVVPEFRVPPEEESVVMPDAEPVSS